MTGSVDVMKLLVVLVTVSRRNAPYTGILLEEIDGIIVESDAVDVESDVADVESAAVDEEMSDK